MATTSQPIAYKVGGVIYDEYDFPLQNVLVKVFDKDLRTEKFLAEKLTDPKGTYAITFKAEAPLNPEYKSADVLIKVFDSTGQLLGQSPVYFNVGEETTINYKIGITPYKGLNEFDALVAIIQPTVKSSNLLLGDLQQNDKFDDFNFLAGETVEDATKIQLLNTAFVFSKNNEIAPDIFYGLFRLGFPTVLNELLLIKASSIKKAIQQAIDENIISSKFEKGIEKIIITLNGLSVKKITDGDDEQSAAFKKLFGTLFTKKKQQEAFIGTYFDNEETPEKFWDTLNTKDGFKNTNAAAKTKQLLSLYQLTDNQSELAKHLFSKQSSDPDLKEISGYAKFTKADWQQQITAAAVTAFPAWVKGDNAAEKTAHYAESLETLHKQLYPTTYFAARMKQDGQSAFPIKHKLNSFFNKNPDFELNTTNIHKQLATANFENATDKEAVTKELKTINRLYKLTDDYKQVNELYGKQLFSSTDIVTKYGREQFVKQFTSATGSAEATEMLYKKAVSVNNKVTALITAYKMRNDVKIYAINGDSPDPEGYYDMFGDGELCDCEHCQSIYSPAAYFADMLHFIKSNDETAYNELIRRRPDLDDILLTCRNTNTPLPYIDLVNELLEKKVVALSAPEAERFSIENHSFQTEGLEAELLASPEHINYSAYDHLKIVSANGVFSSSLPLELPHEEIKSYAEKLGWKRVELMEIFSADSLTGSISDVSLAAELFGFSKSELAIINGSNAFTVEIPLDQETDIPSVKAILEKTKLSYIELLQLLETYFLNPAFDGERILEIDQVNDETTEPPLLTCNLDRLILNGVNSAWLNKMTRFVRLWKKIGWDIFDLDRILRALGINGFPESEEGFNNTVLLPLANVEITLRKLKITPKQATALYNDIDSFSYLDHAKEGQPSIPSLQDDLFKGIIANDAAAVCAAFNITAEEYSELETGLDFSISNLSRSYRLILLSRSLRISIKDLKTVLAISGSTDLGGAWQPAQLCHFLKDLNTFKATGIKPDEFRNYFNAASDIEFTFPVDYRLIRQNEGLIHELKSIHNNSNLTEEERRIHCVEKVSNFLNDLNSHSALIEALQEQPLVYRDDIALESVLQNYLGALNIDKIKQLPSIEMVIRMESLQRALINYIDEKMKKVPSILEKFKFSTLDKLWLSENKASLGIAMIWNNPIDFGDGDLFNAFKNLFHLAELSKYINAFWIDLVTLGIGSAPNDRQLWIEKFTEIYPVPEAILEFLCGPKEIASEKGKLNWSFPEDYLKAENIIQLFDNCKTINKLGGNIEQLRAFLSEDVSPEESQSVKNLLQSKYGSKEWLEIIKSSNDKLRKKRRDALVAWILADGNDSNWKSADDIYASLLIDTQMESCMVTSRLKQAISSVQLYIDRCLMNLETTLNLETENPEDTKKVILDEEFAEQWHTWRKQYRVWEANRKIFLYPENWIEPDLRDDASPFFKELESQLKQNEVTEETAREALITYLHKLDTVANLEMVGLFNDEETNIVHVFGRTQNIPHQYFYRKQENNVWTAWEKVELDIEGDHILPVVWNGRLMLFWGMFTEKQEENGGSTSIEPVGNTSSMTMSSKPAQKYLEMKLAWSECKDGKWGGKKISQKHISTKPFLASLGGKIISRTTNISMTSYFDKGKLKIIFHILSENFYLNGLIISLGRFTFNNCNAAPSRYQNDTQDADFVHWMIGEKTTIPNSNWISEGKGVDLFSINKQGLILHASDSIGNRVPIFSNTPGSFNLTPTRRWDSNLNFVPFFYTDQKHNLFVKAVQIAKPALTLPDSTIDSIFSRLNYSASNKIIRKNPLSQNPISVLDMDDSNSLETSSTNNSYPIILSNFVYTQYSFYTFYHPFVCRYRRILAENGIDSLYKARIQDSGGLSIFTDNEYVPSIYVNKHYPKEEVDFSYTGSYSNYNWELFYHIPLLIATRLTQNQKFEEARKWFHYIFDPTKATNENASAKRFWITKPFRQEIENGILSLEDLLSLNENSEELDTQLSNWEQNPFYPHAVARLRISAYMRNTVLRYIDNLIQWGDQLFKRDTIESINEATLLYILASNILGKKQETVPARARPVEKSFSNIAGELDRFGNIKGEIESFISPSSGNDNILMPYFCLPKNDYLLKFWDTVADRLFKVRHCMNIEGTVRQLPLFEPPIDPALLVRATAAGLNLNEILNDMNASLPNYRFQVMLQQANELCNDVKSLGSSLLSALEKKDGEEMALLRSAHELRMLEMIKDLKEKQRDEAKESLESLNNSRLVIEAREEYYSGREFMNIYEKVYFASIPIGMIYQNLQIGAQMVAAVGYTAPEVTIGPLSSGATFGGRNIGDAATVAASAFGIQANNINTIGALSNTYGSFKRREDDWKFQANSAELELKQIDKQIIAAEIRLAIAEKEIENHTLQMEQSTEVNDYMRSKFTNAELYDWMVGQLSTVYFQSYQIAYSTAKKAEKCLQHELGLETTNYIQFGYWDSLKKGLLSGEKLQFDLRRLENAYLVENRREYEIVKHVSLIMLNPLAIVQLRETGTCDFEIPEVLFDLDYAGHYFRRIKSVSISLPCVAGPCTSVSATLKLIDSHCRVKNDFSENSLKQLGKDQSITTSTGQNDSGVFELNFRDERYLPFEGCGAISNWKLELPNPTVVKQFDYNTISDVIIHLKYTAREGNTGFKSQVENSLINRLNEIAQQIGEYGLHIAINMKQELSNEWHVLKKTGRVDLMIDKSRFPYMVQSINTEIESVLFVAKVKVNLTNFILTIENSPGITEETMLEKMETLELYKGINTTIRLNTTFSLAVEEPDKLEELLLIVKYVI